MKGCILLAAVAMLPLYATAQINGNTGCITGYQYTYSYTPMQHVDEGWWSFSNGTQITEWQDGQTFYATVEWQFAGPALVYFFSGGNLLAQMNVSIVHPPPAPATSISYHYQCGSTIVSRNSSPSSDYLWFWQTEPNGTRTDLGSSSSITIATPTDLYLRAITMGVYPSTWGPSSLYVGTISIVTTPTVAGVIGYNGNVCLGTSPAPITNISSATGAGTITYWWEATTGPNGEWETILWAPNSDSFQPVPITKTTSYKRRAQALCGSDYSNTITVSVFPVLNAGKISGTQTVNYGQSGNILGNVTGASGSDGAYTYQWQKSANGSTWYNIEGANGLSYTTESLTTKTYFQRLAITQCETVPSNVQIIDVIPPLSPDVNMNYIITNSLQTGITDENLIEGLTRKQMIQKVVYYDDLGRSLQEVSTQASPLGKDMVLHHEYDDIGRVHKTYLPYASTEATGVFKADAVQKVHSFYNNSSSKVAVDGAPYARTILEASPLNRLIKQGAPGAAWQPDGIKGYSSNDRTIKKSYQTNAENEVLQWIYSEPTADDSLGTIDAPGSYAANTLFKNLTKDENQNEVIEYTDLEGKVILKRVQATTSYAINNVNYASTYYIYDDLDNLVCVIPPEAVKRIAVDGAYIGKSAEEQTRFLQKWAFRYRYDGRRRMIMKQLPGAKYVYMLYDDRDRLVMTQDGKQRALAAKEWTFTKYDALNRAVLTGTYTDNSSPSSLQNAINIFYANIDDGEAWFETYNASVPGHVMGYDNRSFPQVSDISKYLTATYYDVYDSFIAPAESSSHVSQNLPGETVYHQEKVMGQVTATRVKNLTTGAWMRAVNYYDNDYRVIQTIADHHKGTVRTSNVYDFIGKLVHTQRKYIVDGTSTTVKESFTYDHVGRNLTVEHAIGEGTNPTVLSVNEYNELGQLVAKKLHRSQTGGDYVTADPAIGQPGVVYDKDIELTSFNSAQHTQIASNSIRLRRDFYVPRSSRFTARIGFSQEDAEAHNNAVNENFLQVVDYRYNIRGWLSKINDPTASHADDLFNMELAYNMPSVQGIAPQYNGNISGAVWKSVGLDRQSYGYVYDNMSRLTEARYFNAAKPETHNGRYDEKIGVGTGRPGYDLNGNIQNLLRKGKTGESTYGVMDDLHYDYTNNGNRLVYVSDDRPTDIHEEGFKEITGGESNLDYHYDPNGNMIKDKNKGIENIEYNYLNLPSKVSKSASDYIVYTYDATGRKLSQQVFGTSPKITDYIGELVFEGNALQFLNHSEGRAVKANSPTAPAPWEYQYFLKDHLGNIRVVFGEKKSSVEYKATMESDRQAEEQQIFRKYNALGGLNLFDHTDDGTTHTKSLLLHGGENYQIGLAKSFAVNPGDVIDLEVYAKYQEAASAPANNVYGLLSELVSAFSLGAGTSPLDGSQAQAAFSEQFPTGGPWITSGTWDPAAPKAYLNYILFDENFDLVTAGFDQISDNAAQVGASPDINHDLLSLHVHVQKKGYLYIYVSNENLEPVNVYFDDMRIVHNSAIGQVNDYYPFGLTYNSYETESSTNQKYQYNGKELQAELELGWLDYGARMYMPEIGRWGAVDPHADKYEIVSSYNYAFNNPLLFVDPNGKDNIIYLLIAGGFDKEIAKAVAAQATIFLRDLGLKEIEVKFFDEQQNGAFNPNKLATTDNWAVIGDDRMAVAKKARALDRIDDANGRDSNGKSSYEYALDEWETSKTQYQSNPEKSNNHGKNGIVVDYNDTFSEKGKKTNAAIMVNHGAAHSSVDGSKGHSKNRLGIFADGQALFMQYLNGGYEAILEKQRNREYISMMMQRYSSPKAVDRYHQKK